MAIPLPVGRPAIFNCGDTPRDSVSAARSRYYAAIADSIGGSHIQAGYWALDFNSSREWCYAEGNWESDGMFHQTEGAELYGCFNVDSYTRRWISTGDDDYNPYYTPPGGGGPDTNTSVPPDGDIQPIDVPVIVCQPTETDEPTPDQINQSADVSTALADIDNEVPAGMTECSGSGAVSCMENDPGVYLGVLPLQPPLGLIFNHTAIATTSGSAPVATELWAVQSGATVPGTSGVVPIYMNNIHVRETAPHSASGWAGYRWLKIGATTDISTINSAIDYTTPTMQNKAYLGSSNVFVGNVLGHAHMTLDANTLHASNIAPGLCTCAGVCVY